MLLVNAVESLLYPLGHLAYIHPDINIRVQLSHALCINSIRKSIRIFFCNGVPLSMTCQFFAACGGHPFPLVKRQFGYLYDIWSQPGWRPPVENTHHCYDMREGRYRCIDGSHFGILAPEIGLEGTVFPTVIRSILRGVNRMELREY